MYQMKQNQTKNSLNITTETKPGKKPTKMTVGFQNISRTGTIHPGIFLRRTLWADSASPWETTIASREQFKPIRILENLVVTIIAVRKRSCLGTCSSLISSFFLIFSSKMHNIAGFILQSFWLSTKTIRAWLHEPGWLGLPRWLSSWYYMSPVSRAGPVCRDDFSHEWF